MGVRLTTPRREHTMELIPPPTDGLLRGEGNALETLADIERRVLWLATSMIHHANKVRPSVSGVKVGGHQASSASIVSIMTALWFGQLRPEDRVSVKPHASPVLHSINYLLGGLDEKYLTTLRQLGGLQSYPSRSKDPDHVDYSTGSVGIGATAPIWGAISRRYIEALGGTPRRGRQYSLVGDAELDEGAVWEAVLESSVGDLGEIVWIVDLNRQSLDRVVPNIAAGKIELLFSAAGWQVITVRFGHLLEELMQRPHGDALRRRILDMSNPEYQRLLRCTASELRERLPGCGEDRHAIVKLIAAIGDAELLCAIRNLGGHDLQSLLDAYAQIDDSRPTVIIAYTIKGHGLPHRGAPTESFDASHCEAVPRPRQPARGERGCPVFPLRPGEQCRRAVRFDGRSTDPRAADCCRASSGAERLWPNPRGHGHNASGARPGSARSHT
jgi:pyruvate dehydrogenase E1 component